MTSEQRTQAEALLAQGLSYREVEEQTGISRSTLHRAFPKKETTEPVAKPEIPAMPKPGTGTPIGNLALEKEHEREMAKLALQREGLAIERKKLELQEQQTDNDARAIALKETKEEAKSEKKYEKRSRQKTKLVNRLKGLIRDILENCVDATWDRLEVNEYMDELKQLQDRIMKVATREGIDEAELAIYQNVTYLIDFMQEELDEQPGYKIKLDLDRDERRELEALKVLEFDEEYQEEDDEKEDDDSANHQPKKGELAKQEKYVEEVNGLVKQLSEAIEDDEFWDSEDLDQFLGQVQDAKKEVRKLAKSLDLDPDSLAIVQTLDFLKEHIDECVEAYEKAQGSPKKLAAYYEDRDEEQEDEMIKINVNDELDNTILEDWSVEEFDDAFDEGEEG